MPAIEKQKWFLQMMSFKEMTVRKSVAHLWTERDILEQLIKALPFKRKFLKELSRRETIEDRVKDKISNLVIPESLKEQMNLIVKPVGGQIVEWMMFMRDLFKSEEILDVHLLEQLSWTTQGTIDYGKTAEKIVGLQTLDVEKRFEIACVHCLVDSLPLVWKELPEEYKKNYSKARIYRELKKSLSHCTLEDKLLKTYWAFVLKGLEHELLERNYGFYSFACMDSARNGYKLATEFFCQKITNKDPSFFCSSEFWEKFVFLNVFHLSLPREILILDAIFYLFQQMDPEWQMQIFEKYPGFIFQILLRWPRQDLFWDKTDHFWISVSERNSYEHLLRHVEIQSYYCDSFFAELFPEFFRRSRSTFRKYFVNQECLGKSYVFKEFLYWQDKEVVKVILRNIDSQDRVRLVSCKHIYQQFTELLDRNGQHLVELCVRESFPSKEDRERLKEVYMAFIIEDFERELKEITWQRFFQSLDETNVVGIQKRSLGKREGLKRKKVL